MRRLVALALLAIFAYSLYSLLSPSVAVPGGWGALPFSSGMPMFLFPSKSLEVRISNPLLDYLLYFIYLILAFFAWISYEIARLLSYLLRVPLIPPPYNRTAPAGIPPTSTAPAIGGGGGAVHQAGSTPSFPLLAVLLAVIAVIAAAALALSVRRQQAEISRYMPPPQSNEALASASPAPFPKRIYSPTVPAVSADLPPPVKPELIKWPLADDVPPVWPLGTPLRIEPAYDGVEISASCCVESSAGFLILSSDTPRDVLISARRGDRREELRVRFSDLHREIANSFFEAFRSSPLWMTAREVLRSRGAPDEVVEIVERAIYSELPLSYQDFVKFYRWIHEGNL